MSYKPQKMKGSPMKRNFGIGEKEEASPGKSILGGLLKGIGASVQAGLDAGAGTSYQKDKEAKAEKEKTKQEKAERDKLAHERAMELINAGKTKSKEKKETEELNNDPNDIDESASGTGE